MPVLYVRGTEHIISRVVLFNPAELMFSSIEQNNAAKHRFSNRAPRGANIHAGDYGDSVYVSAPTLEVSFTMEASKYRSQLTKTHEVTQARREER